MAINNPIQFHLMLKNPEFIQLKEDTMSLIKDWLLAEPAISDRPYYVNGYKLDESEFRHYTARHEVGHIMTLWFSDTKVDVSYATILHPRERKRKKITDRQRFGYKGMKTFLESDQRNCKNYFFDAICLYMGGIRCEQRHYPGEKMYQCERDVHFLCIKAFRLACLTCSDFPGFQSVKSIALAYIKASFEITNKLLMEKKDLFKRFEEELFKRQFMTRDDIAKVLGDRPENGVNLYEKFQSEYLFRASFWVQPYPEQEAVQEGVTVDNSPKIYTQL